MTIVTRAGKGSALTWTELDGNFTDLAGRTNEAWQMDGLEPTLRDGLGNPAQLVDFKGGTFVLSFSGTAMEEAFLNWDVPLEWAPGTDLYAAIHWSPGASTAAGNVRWGFEFTTAAIDGVAAPNQRFLIRFFRDATNGADTFPDTAYLVGVDFYYRVSKFGTPSYTPPFT